MWLFDRNTARRGRSWSPATCACALCEERRGRAGGVRPRQGVQKLRGPPNTVAAGAAAAALCDSAAQPSLPRPSPLSTEHEIIPPRTLLRMRLWRPWTRSRRVARAASTTRAVDGPVFFLGRARESGGVARRERERVCVFASRRGPEGRACPGGVPPHQWMPRLHCPPHPSRGQPRCLAHAWTGRSARPTGATHTRPGGRELARSWDPPAELKTLKKTKRTRTGRRPGWGGHPDPADGGGTTKQGGLHG